MSTARSILEGETAKQLLVRKNVKTDSVVCPVCKGSKRSPYSPTECKCCNGKGTLTKKRAEAKARIAADIRRRLMSESSQEGETAKQFLKRHPNPIQLVVKPHFGWTNPDHPIQDVWVKGDWEVFLGTVGKSSFEEGWTVIKVPHWTNLGHIVAKEIYPTKQGAAKALFRAWGGMWKEEMKAQRSWR